MCHDYAHCLDFTYSCFPGGYRGRIWLRKHTIRRWNEFQEWPMENREKWRREEQRAYWESIL